MTGFEFYRKFGEMEPYILARKICVTGGRTLSSHTQVKSEHGVADVNDYDPEQVHPTN